MTERLDGRRLELPCERAGEAPTTFEWREQREREGRRRRKRRRRRPRPSSRQRRARRHNHSETETSLSLFLGVGEGVSQVLIGLTDPQTDQPKDQFLEGFVWTVKLAGVKIA